MSEKKSKELKAFLDHFKANCSVAVLDTIECTTFFHWKRLVFKSLNCEQMAEISAYIKNTFSVEGRYSHLLPEISSYDGSLCLTVREDEIIKHIIKKVG